MPAQQSIIWVWQPIFTPEIKVDDYVWHNMYNTRKPGFDDFNT